MIPLHIPLNYNEGWNAYFDRRAVLAGTGPLYPGPDSLVFNNYPPLSFYLVGAFGRFVVGDMIVAGRIVALASLLASAALLGTCVRRLGGDRRGSLTASILLLLISGTFFHDYVAMDDPQWLAHALMLGGLAVLLRGEATGRFPPARLVVAALLMVSGGLVKHNLVALPLAVTIWLAVLQRRVAIVWLVACLGALGSGLLATAMTGGNAAFADILAHHRIVRLGRARKAVERLAPLLPMMLIAVRAIPRQADRRMLLPLLWAAISLVTGIAQRFGEGVYYNAHFETLIALCLTTGLMSSRMRGIGPVPLAGFAPAGFAPAGFAILPVLLMLPWLAAREWRDIADRGARVRSWQPVIARIAASPGMAGCESLSLCFWAGKPFAVDLFNLDQSILSGGSIARFDALARAHAFGVFEYGGDFFPGGDPAAFRRDPLLHALRQAGYRPTGTGPDGVMLLTAKAPSQTQD